MLGRCCAPVGGVFGSVGLLGTERSGQRDETLAGFGDDGTQRLELGSECRTEELSLERNPPGAAAHGLNCRCQVLTVPPMSSANGSAGTTPNTTSKPPSTPKAEIRRPRRIRM